jgi:cell division protein FtsL
MTRLQITVFLVLVAALAASMIGVVSYRQQSREMFVELQRVREQLDQQEMLRSRLQLEQSTLANIARVKRLASDRLAMRAPEQVLMMALPETVDGRRGEGSWLR